MSSFPQFGEKTGALEVAKAFEEEIRGKHVLITGAAVSGIGGATAMAIASQHPASLIICGRSEDRLNNMASNIGQSYPDVHVKPLVMDLSSQKSVRDAAKKVLENSEIIDLLINNAGIALSDKRLAGDGTELQLATNHIGHFLFTNLILQSLLVAAKSNPAGSTRVVNLTSLGYLFSPIRFSDYNFDKSDIPEEERPNRDYIKGFGLPLGPEPFGSWEAYGQSKTANILFSVYLNEHLARHGISSFSVHPGLVQTELGRHLPGQSEDLAGIQSVLQPKTLDQGAATTLVAAFDPSLKASSGVLLADCQLIGAEKYAVDPKAAERLWQLSEQIVGQSFSI
ncbi:retinol dehydrogenase [Penicillium samsonianum]|uniref:retinol dehydrogenase n=1 Tax=Penicillium samsonianum TaxID=1882272 RepID=UPI0025497C6F|nr:retinol dehydrogenase [Penicillium samsonianum]KAJ6142769.1 retinol dehydrogenase [Penicillium samsonianum]